MLPGDEGLTLNTMVSALLRLIHTSSATGTRYSMQEMVHAAANTDVVMYATWLDGGTHVGVGLPTGFLAQGSLWLPVQP